MYDNVWPTYTPWHCDTAHTPGSVRAVFSVQDHKSESEPKQTRAGSDK